MPPYAQSPEAVSLPPFPDALAAQLAAHPGARVATIGTRRPTDGQRAACAEAGRQLAQAGAVVVSGGALGADQVFAQAARAAGGRVVCVVPWASYERDARPPGAEVIVFDPDRHAHWLELAAAHHPAWGRCSQGARRLHARNSGILIGEHDTDRVIGVIAAPAADRRGGTEQGIRLAKSLEIPVFFVAAAPPPVG